jgi:hypothetical protein
LWQVFFLPDQLENPTRIWAVELFSGLAASGA